MFAGTGGSDNDECFGFWSILSDGDFPTSCETEHHYNGGGNGTSDQTCSDPAPRRGETVRRGGWPDVLFWPRIGDRWLGGRSGPLCRIAPVCGSSSTPQGHRHSSG